MKFSIISIDYQNDFCSIGGKYYKDRPCHGFIENEFIPFLQKNNIKLAEIICDYRNPRPNETEECCIPGEWGYLSAIDSSVKLPNVWIKSMHSPEWIRPKSSSLTPGLPYQDPEAFNQWLISTIGSPEDAGTVILIGLTLEVCVLSTAQQLSFRGYDVSVLKEASDIYDLTDVAVLTKNNIDYKDILINTSHREFAKLISWDILRPQIGHALHTDNLR